MKQKSSSSANQPFSILFLGTQMATGGAQKILLDQAQWFRERGHKVVAAFFYDRDNLHEKWLQSVNFPLLNLNAYKRGANGAQNIACLLKGVFRLWKILRQERFDVVVTFTHDSNTLGLPLAWLAGAPVRIGTHLGEIRGLPRWRAKIHTALINLGVAQILIAASTKTSQNAIREGVRKERVEIIPNGITPFQVDAIDRKKIRAQLGFTDEDVFLLSVGRLVYEKGHEIFAQAMAAVLKDFPRAKAGVCGSGPLQKDLEAEINRNSIGKQFKLLGNWDNILELLASADIFILPSRWEGLPLALLEAMTAGLPVIAARVEGVEEVIEQGVQGLLVPPENPSALADSILQLANDPALCRKMGTAARQRALGAYTTQRMCERYERVMLKYLHKTDTLQ